MYEYYTGLTDIHQLDILSTITALSVSSRHFVLFPAIQDILIYGQ